MTKKEHAEMLRKMADQLDAEVESAFDFESVRLGDGELKRAWEIMENQLGKKFSIGVEFESHGYKAPTVLWYALDGNYKKHEGRTLQEAVSKAIEKTLPEIKDAVPKTMSAIEVALGAECATAMQDESA